VLRGPSATEEGPSSTRRRKSQFRKRGVCLEAQCRIRKDELIAEKNSVIISPQSRYGARLVMTYAHRVGGKKEDKKREVIVYSTRENPVADYEKQREE